MRSLSSSLLVFGVLWLNSTDSVAASSPPARSISLAVTEVNEVIAIAGQSLVKKMPGDPPRIISITVRRVSGKELLASTRVEPWPPIEKRSGISSEREYWVVSYALEDRRPSGVLARFQLEITVDPERMSTVP